MMFVCLNNVKYIFITVLFFFVINGIAEEKKTKNFLKSSPYIAENAKLEIAYKRDKTFFEGPVWNPADSKLYFTYFGRDKKPTAKVVSLSLDGKFEVFYDNSQGINGMFLAQDGSLLGAQYKAHKVVKLRKNKKKKAILEVIAQNANWFQPNDICQAKNGNIYFSDPDFKKKEKSAVYLLRKGSSKAIKVATNFKISNGLIVSKNQKNLIVADSFLKQWKSFSIKKDGTLGKGKIFFFPKKTPNKKDPDGMTIDEHGNYYLTGMGGIWNVSAKGKFLGFIPVPVFSSNATFGGKDGKTLYITCKNYVYKIQMTVKGLQN